MQLPLRRRAPFLASLLLPLSLLGACTMPHVMGLGSYYAVTDNATGRVYYTDKLSREKRGTVEFADRATGAWTSLPSAQVRAISKAEFRAGPPR